VPGLRPDLVTALVRSLPKDLRRTFVPVPDTARTVLARLRPRDGEALTDALSRELQDLGRVAIPPGAWDLGKVPAHLRITFRVVDERGRTVGQGKDLGALQAQLRPKLRATLAAEAGGIERSGVRDWRFGTLPRTLEQQRAGYPVTVYPAVVDEGDSVGVRVLPTPDEQRRAMARGTRRLLMLALPSPVSYVRGRLDNAAKLVLGRNPHHDVADLLDDCTACAVDALIAAAGGPAWDEAGFAALRENVRADLNDEVLDLVREVRHVLEAAHRIEDRLARTASPELAPAVEDMRAQMSRLVYRGFVAATGRQRLGDVRRYLLAIEQRLDKLGANPRRDRDLMAIVQELEAACGQAAGAGEVRWMIEELRVSFFAQSLGTAYPVSEKRVWRALDALSA
jgi:ATP-dependent helicase HrpA